MSEQDLLRVSTIRVTNLFGRYTHEVKLRTEDRVTIIHGPNGVGKTALFHLIAAALSGNIQDLMKIPFDKFEVTLSDGSILGFNRHNVPANDSGTDNVQIRATLVRAGRVEQDNDFDASQLPFRNLATHIGSKVPWLVQLDDNRFLDQRNDELLSNAEIISAYTQYIPAEIQRQGLISLPEWMLQIRGRVKVHLIEAQRLLRLPRRRSDRDYPRASDTYVATVRSYAEDLQRRVSAVLTSYAKQSQSLDQTFPQRLLESSVSPLSADDLKSRMQALEAKRVQLKRIGLMGDDPAYPFDVATLDKLDETRRAALTLYVEDTGTKLGVLDSLARRIEILLDNINRKFTHKSILVDRERGLIARTDDQKALGLDSLSSGEQHELVLLYDLLFRVQPNTLVLIDEPELSLHVMWQKGFLPDLLEVVATTSYDVVLATHSPFIVGERHDLMVALSADSPSAD